jgi:hypothetical protein
MPTVRASPALSKQSLRRIHGKCGGKWLRWDGRACGRYPHNPGRPWPKQRTTQRRAPILTARSAPPSARTRSRRYVCAKLAGRKDSPPRAHIAMFLTAEWAAYGASGERSGSRSGAGNLGGSLADGAGRSARLRSLVQLPRFDLDRWPTQGGAIARRAFSSRHANRGWRWRGCGMGIRRRRW